MAQPCQTTGDILPDKGVRSLCVVRQEHLNQYGSLFGGYLLQRIDELAFVACVRRFPGQNFVTRALQDVAFHTPAHLGDVLETVAKITRVGTTSVNVHVHVYVGHSRKISFDGTVVLVCVDELDMSRPVSVSNVAANPPPEDVSLTSQRPCTGSDPLGEQEVRPPDSSSPCNTDLSQNSQRKDQGAGGGSRL